MADGDDITYEQPLNERIRTFLRLEHLFNQTLYHQTDETRWGQRAAMATLLDTLTIFSRHDLRTEVNKELVRQESNLERLRNVDGVDQARLVETLNTIDTLGREIQRTPPQFAAFLIRDNELLSAIGNRSAIPGGTCGFDLPSYRHWLHRPAEVQAENFQRWWQQLAPFRSAVQTILGLLRQAGQAQDHVAQGGVLVHNTATTVQLLQVIVPNDEHVYPEISAGRHRSTIRFMEQTGADLRVSQANRDIAFKMACCRL